MNEEHTPQGGGQSRLGGRWARLLTCTGCNKSAGESFERTSGATRRQLTESNGHFCTIHPGFGRTSTGIWISVNPTSIELTDLKSAYLMAALVLGHRWFVSDRLDQIREVIAGTSTGTGGAVLVSLNGSIDLERTVSEVTHPGSFVLVVGERTQEGNLGVVLPCNEGPHPSVLYSSSTATPITKKLLPGLPRQGHFETQNLTLRSYKWPRLENANSSRVQACWNEGGLFHLDRCDEAKHRTALSTEMLKESLAPLLNSKE